MNRKVAAVAVVGLLAWIVAAGVTSGSEWNRIAAQRIDSGDRIADVELWTRGRDARYLERRDGRIVYEIQCTGSRLISRSAPPGGVVVRDLAAPERCFELATDPLLGFSRLAGSSPFARAAGGGALDRERYEGRGEQQGVTIELDARTGLPVLLSRDGRVQSRWRYPETGASELPAPIDVSETTAERYVDLGPADTADRFGVSILPDRLAGNFTQYAMFDYTSARRGVSTYAIWRAPDGATIQIVVGWAPDGSITPGIEDQGGLVVLNLVEGENLVQLFAPNLDLLREAARVLRPGAMP